MPQPFINAVMTNAGAEILTRSQAGEGAVVFTRIVTGDGVYEDSEKNITVLQRVTALKNAKNSYRPSGAEKVNEFTVKVTALLSNMDPISHKALVTESYHINEMGLYAKIAGDDEDVLYSVTVVSGAIGDLMPPYNGDNPADHPRMGSHNKQYCGSVCGTSRWRSGACNRSASDKQGSAQKQAVNRNECH